MLLSQHPKVTGHSRSVPTVSINVAVLPWPRVQACVSAHNSAYWAGVAKGKGATSIPSKGIDIAYPVQYLHCPPLNVNHETLALIRRVSCRSSQESEGGLSGVTGHEELCW